MTGENGYDFRALRADIELAEIPLIFITSSIVQPPEHKMGLELGAYKFISRPVQPEIVLAEIAGCLRTHPRSEVVIFLPTVL
jgi:two-component system, cell cycle response regulator